MMIGNADRVVDRLEVLVHALLGRLVVVRRHHQHRVGARLLRMLGKFDRLPGRIGAGAGDHGNAALRLVDAPFDDALVLVMAHGRAFAGGADRHQAVGALGDLPAHQRAKGRLIERAVLERRDQGGERSPEIRLGCHGLPPNARFAALPLLQVGQFISGLTTRRKARAGPMSARGWPRFCRGGGAQIGLSPAYFSILSTYSIK